MTNRTPNGKRTRELLRRLPPGLRIEKVGRKAHLAVLFADGQPLRDERGLPIQVAGTSTVPVERELARVRRALRVQGYVEQAARASVGELHLQLRRLPWQAAEQRAAVEAELARRQS